MPMAGSSCISRVRANQRKVHFLSIIVKLSLRVSGNGRSSLQRYVVSGHIYIHLSEFYEIHEWLSEYLPFRPHNRAAKEAMLPSKTAQTNRPEGMLVQSRVLATRLYAW